MFEFLYYFILFYFSFRVFASVSLHLYVRKLDFLAIHIVIAIFISGYKRVFQIMQYGYRTKMMFFSRCWNFYSFVVVSREIFHSMYRMDSGCVERFCTKFNILMVVVGVGMEIRKLSYLHEVSQNSALKLNLTREMFV